MSKQILAGIAGMGFDTPIAIQQQAIPPIAEGRDVIMQARAGSGKTLAFVTGVLNRVLRCRKHGSHTPQALVVVPFRGLATQCAEVLRMIGKPLGCQTLVAVGGQTSVGDNKRELRRGVDVVVGTPGRMQHLISEGSLDTRNVAAVVLDEADKLLSDCLRDQMREIISACASTTQVIAASATFCEDSIDLLHCIMNNPVSIRMKDSELSLTSVKQYVVDCSGGCDMKLYALLDICAHLPPTAVTVVFAGTRKDVCALHAAFTQANIPAHILHGDLDAYARAKVIRDLQGGECKTVIATGVVARGLDLQHLNTVINYSLPYTPTDYVHRVGRVGRRGRVGVAVTLLGDGDARQMQEIRARFGVVTQPLPSNFAQVY